ncbi:MAG: HAMP domain-containing sensor histidine kinase [Candidatus Omnitrophota bacterium]
MADTGCGIDIKNKDKLFEKFYQRHVTVEGVGIGLTICREVVKRHRGTIEILSRGIGKGAKVVIRLPKNNGH